MAKRKNTRMFSREQRRQARAEQLARAATISLARTDEALIESYLTTCAALTTEIATAWLALRGESDPTDFERRTRDAMGRELRRRTGRRPTPGLVEELVARDEEERDSLYEREEWER